jgi:hypothetical protein
LAPPSLGIMIYSAVERDILAMSGANPRKRPMGTNI